MQMLSDEVVVGAKGAADYLGPPVTPRVIYGLMELDRIPVVRPSGKARGKVYIRKADLDRIFKPEPKDGE
jgi:hypothetical protein